MNANGTEVTISMPVHTTNTSATIVLLNTTNSNATQALRANVTAGGTVELNWLLNVTAGAGNYTHQIWLSLNSSFTGVQQPVITYSNTIAVGAG
ncbi:hypothetical protein HY640_04110 [Candidatus Woesearchaeota archaeon]|nr:hypothetical protein [Candidatus Woesearchaeota archaeon]